jgi:hypothetical protein
VIDKALNVLIGYSRTTADIVGLVRKGRNRMDSLCDWLEMCIVKLKVDPALLEGKMKQLLDAMALL